MTKIASHSTPLDQHAAITRLAIGANTMACAA